MGNIKFEGSPPYALPIAQNVRARAEGAVVEMTLEVITPSKEPAIVPIKVTNDVGFRPFLTCSIAAWDNDGGGAPEAVVIPPCNSATEATAHEPMASAHATAAPPSSVMTRDHRAAEERDELAADHSITSSAVASSLSGTVRPSAFAVLRLITNSSFVACMTGRSAGFSPLRMRPA
jgi:hypothetical protein